MIRVIRICDVCGNDYEQDVENTPARIGDVVTYPVAFDCSDCILAKEREINEQRLSGMDRYVDALNNL